MSVYYHTQEKRENRLKDPIICRDNDSWLGEGYYFWRDEDFADFWGVTKKAQNGAYQIYKANIEDSNVIDTVFNRDHYDRWLEILEKIAIKMTKKTGRKPSGKDIYRILKEKNYLGEDVHGILFDDIPKNEEFSRIKYVYYRKRIQLVVYTKNIIGSFSFFKEVVL